MNEENNVTKQELGEKLHHKQIEGDPTATARIAELFFESILYRLQKKNAKEYHDLVASAVQEAFLNYFKRPEQYNPDRGELEAYLYMSANGDFRNLLDKERRYLRKIDESVELDTDKAEYITEVAEKNVGVNTGIKESSFWHKIEQIVPDPVDQELVILLLDGVRQTEEYATVLSITDQPIEDQRKIVKQHKDRLKKQLQRKIDPSELKNV